MGNKTKNKKKKKLTCPQCNKKVKAKWRFCRNCNYPLGGKSKKKDSQKAASEKTSSKDVKFAKKTPKLFKSSVAKIIEPIVAVPEKVVEEDLNNEVAVIEEVVEETIVEEIVEYTAVEDEIAEEVSEDTTADDEVLEEVEKVAEDIIEAVEETVADELVAVPEVEETDDPVYGWRTATAGYEAIKTGIKMPEVNKVIEALDEMNNEVTETVEDVVKDESIEEVAKVVVNEEITEENPLEEEIPQADEMPVEDEPVDEVVEETVQEDAPEIKTAEEVVTYYDELPEVPATVAVPETPPNPESVAEETDEVEEPSLETEADIEPAEPEFEPLEVEPPIFEAAPIEGANLLLDVEPMPEVDPLPEGVVTPITDEPVPVAGEDLNPDEKPQGEPVAIIDPEIASNLAASMVAQMPIEDPPASPQPTPSTPTDIPDGTSRAETVGEEKKSNAGWIAGIIVGCVLCLLLGGVIGTAIQKNADSKRLQEAEERLEVLEERLQEANPGHGIYNIEQLDEYLNEEFGLDTGDGTIFEELIENLNSGQYGQAQDTGRKGRGMMGVEIATSKDGVVVSAVENGSAADKAGIEKGDVIETINNKEVSTSQEVVDITSKTDPGDTITVGIKGKGNIEITLE